MWLAAVDKGARLSWLTPAMTELHTLGMDTGCVLGKIDIHSPTHLRHDVCLHLQGEELSAGLCLSVIYTYLLRWRRQAPGSLPRMALGELLLSSLPRK